jgi:hypothetical protein
LGFFVVEGRGGLYPRKENALRLKGRTVESPVGDNEELRDMFFIEIDSSDGFLQRLKMEEHRR